ncbi:MAG TPA: hypothetical protein VFZ49_07455 [Pyrinomonadaceae bacterium]
MSDTEKKIDKLKDKLKRWGLIAGAILLAFLVGLMPMWLMARDIATERDEAQTQLRKSEMGNLLLLSIVDARRGEYEVARQEASEFFTRLRAEDDKGDDGFLTANQRAKIKTIFADRDAAITLLAQRDPASVDRLTEFYVAYMEAVPIRKAESQMAQGQIQ